jgi:peroxiredoxin family protein
MSTMVIGVASGSIEKLVVASTLAGGAVALAMDVEIYLLLGGAYAFRKDVAGVAGTYAERPELKEEMLAGMANNSVPEPLDNFRTLRAAGQVKIHVCGTAGKIWGAGTLDDFIDIVDDIVGITEYIDWCERAEVVQVV